MNLKAPIYPESISEGVLLTWQVKENDFVNQGDLLVEIEIEKIVLEIRAPESGKITKLLVNDGETIVSEQKIAELDTSQQNTVAITPTNQSESNSIQTASTIVPNSSTDFSASPAARKMMNENNLNANDIQNQTQNKITKEDVVNTMQNVSMQLNSAPNSQSLNVNTANPQYSREQITKPMSEIRKTIAKRLLAAKNETAMLTTFNEVDMSAVIQLRKKYKDDFEKKFGIKLGFMSFFVKATVQALKEYPLVNAAINDNEIVYNNFYDISIAVSAPTGLIVPIVRDCSEKNFADVELSIADFSNRAKNNQVKLEEMQGGTFTISNGGIFGSLLSTPILNPPQSAILGLHKIQERPIAVNGEIQIRPMMNLAVSYDHRIIDGREAVSFLINIKNSIEDPCKLLLEI